MSSYFGKNLYASCKTAGMRYINAPVLAKGLLGFWTSRRGESLRQRFLPSLHNAPDRSETYHRIWQISGVKDKPVAYRKRSKA